MKLTIRSCIGVISISGAALILSALAANVAVAKGHGASITIAAADLKWNDVPDFPGVKIAVGSGDPAKGAAHFFMKFVPGFAAPIDASNFRIKFLT